MTETEARGDLLLVDDNPENLRVLREILTRAGYRARPAISAAVARAVMEARAPELILLDVQMPEVDGLTFCQQIKEDPRFFEIPVLFLSALTDEADMKAGFDAGGVDYLSKPLREAEVLARVETHLRLARLQHRLEAEVETRTAALLAERRAHERAQALAKLGHWSCPPDGRALTLSPEAARIFALPERSSLFFALGWVHPEDRPKVKASLASLTERGEAEIHLRWSAVPEVEQVLRIFARRNADGFSGTVQDLSDLRALQGERDRAIARVMQSSKMELLGTFATGIGMGLQESFRAIMANTASALSALPPEHDATMSLSLALQAGAEARRMFERLNAFNPARTPELGEHNLVDLAREALALARHSLPPTIEVKLLWEANPFVWGDRAQLQEMLYFLFQAAQDGMKEEDEGQLTLRIRERPADGDLPAGIYASLTVTDTGRGWSADELAALESAPVAAALGRSPYGLSVAAAVAAAQGGRLSVRSTPRFGSLVEVLLPARFVPAPAEWEERRSAPPLRIFVGSAEARVSAAIRAIQSLGHAALGVLSEAALWDALARASATCVLLDCALEQREDIRARLHARAPWVSVRALAEGTPVSAEALEDYLRA